MIVVKDPLRVLLVEDSEDDALVVLHSLRRGGFEHVFKRVETEDEMSECLKSDDWDIVLSDHRLPQFSSNAALELLQKSGKDIPFIIVSGAIGEDVAAQSMKAGANDYILKSNLTRLAPAIERELKEASVRRERKLAEEALRESEAKYRMLVENIPQKVFLKDCDGRYITINRNFAMDLGIEPEDITGKVDYDFFSKEIADKYRADDKKIMKTRLTEEFEEKYIKNGREVWVNTVKAPVIDANGEVSGVLGIFWDITEHKIADYEASRAAQEWQTTFDSTRNAIWILDKEDRVLRANKISEALFKRPIEEILGNNCCEVVHNSPCPLPGCPILRVKNSLSRETKELRIGEKWFEITVDPILDASGEYGGAVHVVNDITERKQAAAALRHAEEQLLQSQKMEAVGRLAGGIAHDFNNMLSVIMGTTQLAIMNEEPDGATYNDFQEILNAAERSADLTRQLLAFARKQTVAPVPLNLNDAVAGTIKMLHRLIGEDINLVWSPGHHLWKVEMDPSQIDQILANMAVNARDAIAGVGKITIETENIVCDEAFCADHAEFYPGEYVRLSISDNGCGMDKETSEHIFEPFFTTKETGKGTGLGLSTVFGIVKQNNGLITVYSEPGKGTTFKICLPRYAGETSETAADGEEYALPGGSETVLIVEDEAAILSVGRRILEKLGYSVLSAIAPEEAVSLFEERAGEIQLLLTDTVMPEMNGRELAERLISINPGLKCLFMSGYTADVIARHGILDKGVNFVQKPFSVEDLAYKLRMVLDK